MLLVPVVCLILVGSAGCDESDNTPPVAAPGGNATGDSKPGAGSGPFVCPVTVAEVSGIVGRPLTEKGNLSVQGSCTFDSDKDLTTSVTIARAGQLTDRAAFEQLRDHMKSEGAAVSEVDKGRMGFIALRPVGSEAFVVGDAGSFAVNLTALYMDDAQKKAALLQLLDAILA